MGVTLIHTHYHHWYLFLTSELYPTVKTMPSDHKSEHCSPVFELSSQYHIPNLYTLDNTNANIERDDNLVLSLSDHKSVPNIDISNHDSRTESYTFTDRARSRSISVFSEDKQLKVNLLKKNFFFLPNKIISDTVGKYIFHRHGLVTSIWSTCYLLFM